MNTAEQRSWNMSRVPSKNTLLEVMVRRYLYSNGFRYRIKNTLPGRPDIIFPKKKIAVFVNGCFWHMHGCKLSNLPKTNIEFWLKKLTGNRIRDMETEFKLTSEGWKVIKLWQCDLKKRFYETMFTLTSLLNQ
jgi:DNA mismatch endonuclease (patch repair protein)